LCPKGRCGENEVARARPALVAQTDREMSPTATATATATTSATTEVARPLDTAAVKRKLLLPLIYYSAD
jgi:hypothetical protein